eukprot:scaffold248459_cov84-Cyclotella_meneghiniana.AAC.10
MVRLESTTGEQIQVFEIETKSFGNNVALNGTARQSSTLRESIDHIASNAIDGNTQTFSHTDDAHPYLEIDLGDRFELHRVIIHNRWCTNSTDPEGCLCKLSFAKLYLLGDRDIIIENRTLGNTCNMNIIAESFTACSLLPWETDGPTTTPSTHPASSPTTGPVSDIKKDLDHFIFNIFTVLTFHIHCTLESFALI